LFLKVILQFPNNIRYVFWFSPFEHIVKKFPCLYGFLIKQWIPV
jgi:hypothetical protein